MPKITRNAHNPPPSAFQHSSAPVHLAKLEPFLKKYFAPEIPLRKKHLAATLLAACFAIPQLAPAQATQLQDPANLTGERVSPQDPADTLPIDHGVPALQQLLLKLRTRASFMLIVAHPDDEDGGLLTYLSRGQGARVAMLTLNRGEGGQNLMSADFNDALGLIRTQELLAADRYMGVDQFFGTEVDFGFSKTKEEAFAKWTHDRVLYDAVRAVRLYRPLVIASVFIGAPSDGHGQHQVSGEIAQEVFNAAGDPNVFPDQIAQGLQPWQPLKVYARIPFARIDAQGMFDYATNQYVRARFTNYVTGHVTNTIPRANVVIPEGDPATYTAPDGSKTPIPGMDGLSYLQFARQGLALQKTQIGSGTRTTSPGPHDVSYHRYGSHITPNNSPQPDGDDDPTLEPTLFSGIDATLPGIAALAPEISAKLRPALEKIDAQIAEAQRLINPTKPELTAPPLRIALATLGALLNELNNPSINDLPPTESYNLLHELRIKRVQLNNALLIADGITLQATVELPGKQHVPASEVPTTTPIATFKLGLSASTDETINLVSSTISTPKTNSPIPGNPHDLLKPDSQFAYALELKGGLPATRPYFSRPDIEQPFYDIADPALRNAPQTPDPLSAHVLLDDQGVRLEIASVIAGPSTLHPPQAVAIVPPASISLDRRVEIVPADRSTVSFNATIHPPASQIKFHAPADWKSAPTSTSASTPGLNPYLFELPSKDRKPVTLQATVNSNGAGTYAEGYRPVGYPGLTYTNYYTPATLRVVPVDVHTAPNLNIAYLPGTGDDIPAALDQLGIHPHILTAAELTPATLKPYDAIILGVRAYEAHPELAAANPALNTYAASGGVVIAQYNTGHLPESTGPYPISLTKIENVVEEDAPVQILEPSDPLLAWPNRITTAAFDNWIEERGHGFMTTWDPHYTALLETHDHGQQPQRGGLLIAHTGHGGAWIYLSFALYRQLPEGVPGAYRILANLISAAKNPNLAK